jgi:PAS domain S-box-containing protein
VKEKDEDNGTAQAEEELKAANQTLSALIQASPLAIIALDLDGNVKMWSPVAERIFGWSEQEVLGRPLPTIPGEHLEHFLATQRSLLQGEVLTGLEVPGQKKDGATIDISLSAAPWCDAQNNVIGTMGIIADITERQRVEEALRESEARYRALVEQVPAAIYSAALDELSTTLYFSPQIEKMLGFPQAEWLAEHDLFLKQLHPDDRERVLAALTSSRASGEPFKAEYRLLARDGSVVWFRDEAMVVRDGDGNPLFLQGVMFDITERKRTEEELRNSEERLKILFESAPDAYYLSDLKGTLVDGNRAAEELIGYKKEELIGKSFLATEVKLLPPGQIPKATALLARNLLGQPTGPDEFTLNRKGSGQVTVEIRTFPVKIAGQSLVLGIARDITGHKRVEEELRGHRDHLEELVAGRTAELRREIDERKRAEEALQGRVELQRLITTLSTHFINLAPTEVDGEINRALQTIGEYAGVDRSYFCLFSDDGTKMASTHEWCAAGIRPQIDNLKDVPVATLPQIMEKLNRLETLYVPRVADFAPDGDAEKELLQAQDIQSFILVPMVYGGSLVGFLGFDSVRTEKSWAEEIIVLLRVVGEIFANALEHKRAEEALERRVMQLTALNQVSQAVTESLELDRVLDGIVSLAGEVTDSDYASVVMVDEKGELIRGAETVPGVLGLEDRARLGGHTRWVIRSRQALVVDGIAEDGTITPWPGEGAPRTVNPHLVEIGIKSLAGLPLTARDRLLGVLYLHSLRPGNFRDQLPLLTTFANQAAIAIENARLYRASRKRSERLAALNVIGTAAVSSLELDTVLRRVLEMTCQALDVAEGSILLREQDTGELVFVLDLKDGRRAMRGQRLAPGQGIAGWVAQHGQAVCVNDVRQDPRFYDGVDAATGFETRSLLCAPLKHRGEVTGVIEVVNKRRGEFDEEDLGLLESVSSIAATALENARLYTTTRAQAEEMMLLNAIGLTLTSTLDFSAVVRAALSQVQRLFRAEEVSLLQPDPQTGELCFVQALVGTTPVEIPVRLAPREGIAGWTLEQRQSALIEDAQDDPRFSARVDKYLGTRTRALMAAPLLTSERAIGVIKVASSEPGTYTREELHTLQSLASTLAVALENARLYEEQKSLLHELEQAQAQLIHSEKMAALGRLIASLTHEINNPLQGLHNCLGLLLNRPWEESQRRYLEIAGSETKRLIAIMERLRGFYRPPAERRERVDVNVVLDGILALSGKQLQEGRVTVRRELAAGLPAVEIVEGQLKQVFLNLVLNALDAMPGGGELAVATGWDGDRREVRVSFADTGEGIPAEEIARIFEPFYTTRPKGTGLGLAVSYSIVERHEGRIEVASQVGAGSTFTVFLPATGGVPDAEPEGEP